MWIDDDQFFWIHLEDDFSPPYAAVDDGCKYNSVTNRIQTHFVASFGKDNFVFVCFAARAYLVRESRINIDLHLQSREQQCSLPLSFSLCHSLNYQISQNGNFAFVSLPECFVQNSLLRSYYYRRFSGYRFDTIHVLRRRWRRRQSAIALVLADVFVYLCVRVCGVRSVSVVYTATTKKFFCENLITKTTHKNWNNLFICSSQHIHAFQFDCFSNNFSLSCSPTHSHTHEALFTLRNISKCQ